MWLGFSFQLLVLFGAYSSSFNRYSILAIDLGTDMVPALGLGVEPPEEGVMDKQPRRLSDHLLNRQGCLNLLSGMD